MLRVRLTAVIASLFVAAALFIPNETAGAQGVPGGAITFRCPGVTEVSATADSASPVGRNVASTVVPLSPADAAESPCILAGAEPEVEWSADYVAERMTSPGTWRSKLRTVLEDFDALHRQYIANPRIKDMGMWPARLEETLQLANLLAYRSQQDVVVYYAGALRDEYKAGIYDERPLLTQYGLQARDKLGELTAPQPTPTPHPRARR